MSYLLISAISKVVSLLYVKSAKASKTTSYRAFFYISGEISDGSTIVDLCLEFQPARYNTNIPNEPPAWKPRFHYVRIAWARAHKKVGNREMHSMVNDAAQKSENSLSMNQRCSTQLSASPERQAAGLVLKNLEQKKMVTRGKSNQGSDFIGFHLCTNCKYTGLWKKGDEAWTWCLCLLRDFDGQYL